MIKYMLSAGSLCAATFLYAQIPFASVYTDTAFNFTTTHDHAQVARADNGDVVVVLSVSVTISDRYIEVLRCAAGGEVQWMRRIACTSGELWSVTDMALTPDGSIAITGTDGVRGLFLRLDPTGVPVAAKKYSGSGNTATTTLVVLNDDQIVLYGNDRQGGSAHGWAAVVSGEGDLLEPVASFQVDGRELASVQTLLVPPDKALLFGRSDIQGPDPQNAVAAVLVDGTGASLWSARFFDDLRTLRPVGAMVLPDGSARLVVHDDGGFLAHSLIVIAVSAEGEVLWMKELHTVSETWSMVPVSLAPMSDASMAIIGVYDGIRPGVLVLDTAANVMTHRTWTFAVPAGEGYRDVDGQLVLGAQTLVSGSFDVALLRTDASLGLCAAFPTVCLSNAVTLNVSSGYTTGSLNVTTTDILPDLPSTAVLPELIVLCSTTAVLESAPATRLVLFPDPAVTELRLKGSGIEEVRILDGAGRLVRALASAPAGEMVLDVGGLDRGLYHVHVRTASGWSAERFIKE